MKNVLGEIAAQRQLRMQQKSSCRNVLSLFSGCGGLDLGFEGGFSVPVRSVNREIHPDWAEKTEEDKILLRRTGFRTVFANDILPFAKTAWEKRFGRKDVCHLGSVVDLVKRAENGKFRFPENISVVTGGFPCQDFSVAGKRMGFDSYKNHDGSAGAAVGKESRGSLYLWMRKVIELVKPKIFIAENVKGLVSLGDAKRIIENDFRHIGKGYFVPDAQVLKAWEYGIPQSRERIVFIGISREAANPKIIDDIEKNGEASVYYPYPVKTHGAGLSPVVTCGEAIQGLAEPEK